MIIKNIITGNEGFIKSYDYNENKIYHKYTNISNKKDAHNSLIIQNKENLTELIESSKDGKIRLWNFHSGELINTIDICHELLSICLWNDEYLYVSCDNNTIKLVDYRNKKIIGDLINHNKFAITIKKVIHSQYGECLISQGFQDDYIKLWINKN